LQTVTNYDSHAWEAGSFISSPGATGSPEGPGAATGYWIGTAISDVGASVVGLEAINFSDPNKARWERYKNAGIWTAWVLVGKATNDDAYVNVTGDTMSGDLTIAKPFATLNLSSAAASDQTLFNYRSGGLSRWSIMTLGSTNDLQFLRYDDAGAYIGSALGITRATGNVTFGGDITVAKPTAVLNLNDTANNIGSWITGQRNGAKRWEMALGYPGAAADFSLDGYSDAGVGIEALRINRITGLATFGGAVQSNAGRIMARTLANSSVGVWDGGSNAYGMFAEGASLLFGLMTDQGVPTMNGATAFINAQSTFFQVSSALARKPGGGTWTDSSDARIKNVLGNYDNGLDAILQLQPVRYAFKGNDTPEGAVPQHRVELDENAQPLPTSKDAPTVPYGNSPHYNVAVEQQEFIGLIAQAVEGAIPEMVSRRAAMIDGQPVTDMRDLDTGPLLFALVNAVKTMAARIEALEAQLTVPVR